MFIELSGAQTYSMMIDLKEKELSDEIDREVSDKGGLVALVLCLSVAGGLLLAGTMAIFAPV